MFYFEKKAPFYQILWLSARHWWSSLIVAFPFVIALVLLEWVQGYVLALMLNSYLFLIGRFLLFLINGIVIAGVFRAVYLRLVFRGGTLKEVFQTLSSRLGSIVLSICIYLAILIGMLWLASWFQGVATSVVHVTTAGGALVVNLVVGGFVCVCVYLFYYWLPLIMCSKGNCFPSMFVSSTIAMGSSWRQVGISFLLMITTIILASTPTVWAYYMMQHDLKLVYDFVVYGTLGIYTVNMMVMIIDNARFYEDQHDILHLFDAPSGEEANA